MWTSHFRITGFTYPPCRVCKNKPLPHSGSVAEGPHSHYCGLLTIIRSISFSPDNDRHIAMHCTVYGVARYSHGFLYSRPWDSNTEFRVLYFLRRRQNYNTALLHTNKATYTTRRNSHTYDSIMLPIVSIGCIDQYGSCTVCCLTRPMQTRPKKKIGSVCVIPIR